MFSTLIIVRHQFIRIISEGSCDTGNWSNVAEISALSSQQKKIYSIFDQINAAMVSIKNK